MFLACSHTARLRFVVCPIGDVCWAVLISVCDVSQSREAEASLNEYKGVGER